MSTVQAEETRRFTPAELRAMRREGIVGADEPVELVDGRLTVDGRLRPIWPDEAIAMEAAGILDQDERVELIDGELWLVTAQGDAHMRVIIQLNRTLVLAYEPIAWVGPQGPARMLGPNLPEPDFFVSRPITELRHVRADDLLLVIEVTVTSYRRDRRKRAIYAEAGVPELWQVDVPARTATIYTGPRPDGSWDERRTVGEDETLALPGVAGTLMLRDVLPPAAQR